MPLNEQTRDPDAHYIGAVKLTGTTDWTDLKSEDLYNQTAPDGAGGLLAVPVGQVFSWVMVDASSATTDVNLKLAAREAADDDTGVTLRIPAGGVLERGLRGLAPPNAPVETICVKLSTAADEVYVSANFDYQR